MKLKAIYIQLGQIRSTHEIHFNFEVTDLCENPFHTFPPSGCKPKEIPSKNSIRALQTRQICIISLNMSTIRQICPLVDLELVEYKIVYILYPYELLNKQGCLSSK